MGTITSGIGLISGINTADLIDQLLAIEARPKQLLQQRVSILQSQNTALAEISARTLSLGSAISSLVDTSLYKSTTASSGNKDILTASSSSSATPGTYNFNVARLVSSQQTVTRGFADTAATPVASAGGALTFEFGDARLDSDTYLSQLNGSEGVSRGKIRITDRSGNSAIVDLSKAVTVNDVLDTINNATGVNVIAGVDGDHFTLTDNTGAAVAALKVENVGSTGTATSLGLAADADLDPATVTGTQVNRVSAGTLVSTLNDNAGVAVTAGDDLTFTAGAATFGIDLNGLAKLGDVITAINSAAGNTFITAAINDAGTGIKLTNSSGGGVDVTGAAAADLGIAVTAGGADVQGNRLVAALNSRLISSLNGGAGAALGALSITNRAGVTTAVDLSSAGSVSQVIDLINDSGAGVTASLNNAGNGLLISDDTGAAASNLIISGAAAAGLGLEQDVAADSINSGNLQLRYISAGTRLDALNGGSGIARGEIRITDASGATALVDLSQGNEVAISDVINEINSRGLQINARVNDNGDGIVIENTGVGAGKIKVEESGSTTARDLGLLGEAETDGGPLVGSFEKTITLEATDTLEQVRDKINQAGLNAKASIINDGSQGSPYRLALTAGKSGRAGAFVFDDGGLNMGATNLVEAHDAVVFYGSANAANAIPIVSTSNTLTNVVPGVTIDLRNTSTTPVELVISRDDSAVTKGAESLVTAFNSLIDTLNKHDAYDSETKQRGLLLGDSTVARVRSTLYSLVNARSSDLTGRYNSLSQVGITVGSGAKLQFNAEKFNQALATDRDAVVALFSFKETQTDDQGVVTTTAAGVGVRFNEAIKRLTDTTNGVLQTRTESINREIQLDNDRITRHDEQLAAKRLRLQTQFTAMEKVLSQLQSQSSALTSLANLAASAGS
ncbi:MAG: flagellar filament capping protein FliD [Phycisphaeraceae bacterium]